MIHLLQQFIQNSFPLTDKNHPIQKEFLEFGESVEVKAGEYLIDLNEEMNFAPIVTKGVLKVTREDEDGNEIFLYYLEYGETCTIAMMYNESAVRVTAEEDTMVYKVPIAKIDEWMLRFPEWRNFVMNAYKVRFDGLLKAIDELAFKKMDERLLNYLGKLSDIKDSNELHISHSEIALNLNTSREVISRLLKQLEKIGKVNLGRNKVILK
ncbi:cyclic nucleotide-binding domain-containing protein [Flammeovirga yaeyamensis]|uniref:Cyclic nucleotide-binding domain-containing protein n=1 Tax=Flammeovirga yaeyamensis TaxID=367791 RepID=A0AAX1MZ22_9BACT|nr:Crp/Fnr family transcriptional regulator [Flammeovirga yaeyamensis]MBB3696106.1 CRP/FNR family transcriptional regulator [Flammeovirga yaeyamensis]NMF34791.1 Crp/Fnr family transcriptional regulator [Flammeovirga yaeyamensis]QWG00381.1 cyclic nucleotide-binding domain-containing protein [Flammeovirga yaeyamensis]